MATKFLNKKTHRFYFVAANGKRKSYVLTFGDEVNTRNGTAPSGSKYKRIEYRGRLGEWKPPTVTSKRSLEMYFLDVGQGDAAFVVTPNNTKILVDGGLRDRALGFLIWKYRLDIAGNTVTIDHLFLSHADKDHVEGLIPLLNHPQITVTNIYHNGIGLFDSGFNTAIGNRSANGRLTTLHDSIADLDGLDLASGRSAVFGDWIQAVKDSNAHYQRLDQSHGVIDVGDPDITVDIIGPVLEPDGQSLKWLGNKSHTINGHSLVFRITYNFVRTFFSGDLNEEGSEHILAVPNAPLAVNAHVFKAPHHGSHEYSTELFNAVKPMVTVVSSGEVPDHGHPRANFLGTIGRAGRGDEPLIFSTEIAALFVDAGDDESIAHTDNVTTFGDLNFAQSTANTEARQRFKKLLPGIINVRTDGDQLYVFRRVQQGYQWESYGPIDPEQ
ncbi:MAG: MBL fold metallo-hydrolase [Thiotrichales bacterium]|nr:MBL fold metallo-hydrolase [Thiotrichales bacterium]